MSTTAPATFAASDIVAGYRLLWRLGRGASGDVWHAEHIVSREPAAVKVLKRNADTIVRALFINEARTLARLCHPHIVGVFDFGEDFVITALVEGDDLERRLQTPLSPRLALRITLQVASALSHAHARGVVHRDVKPGNILIDHNDNAFLTDFGLASLLDSAVEIAGGTPSYMAPEQADGAAPTTAADQFSLARTLLHMLIGRKPPMDADEALALLPGSIPRPLGEILERATSSDPWDRFPTIAELANELETVDVSDLDAPMVLAPERRASAPWCTLARDVITRDPNVFEARFRLSATEGALPAAARAAFTERTRYAEIGWSLFTRADRLGMPTDPAVLARATSLVVVMPGLGYVRESWSHVARSICRDNAQTAVLTLDLYGFGESAYVETPPPPEMLRGRGMMTGVLELLHLLGVRAIPTCFVAHSLSTIPVLSLTDAELGLSNARLAVAPLLPDGNPTWQRLCAGAPLLDTYPRLLGWALWPVNVARIRRATRRLESSHQASAIEELKRYPVRLAGRGAAAWARERPVSGSEMRRCKWLCGTEDEIVPKEVVERAIVSLGFEIANVHWCLSRDHYPHLPKHDIAEETARNLAQIAKVVNALLRDIEKTAVTEPGARDDEANTLDRREGEGLLPMR